MQTSSNRRNMLALAWGGLIGILGGLIGLGGAEFRLPVLVGVFRYRTLQAIIINLIVSLVTVVFSFIFRTGLVNFDKIIANSSIVLNILSGSLMGAYLGARFASSIDEKLLSRIVAVFLIFLSLALMSHDFIDSLGGLTLSTRWQIGLGLAAGVLIGIFSSMLGVAGGELIIPTIVFLFATDIKLAGSLSLAISAPTIVVGLLKYRSQGKLDEARGEKTFIGWTSLGSILGALVGSALLVLIPGALLYYLLGSILLVSAVKLVVGKTK
ncbi:MAG: sulfite exporter TauE/SafE family protein [Anaerolineales bacterium]|nr:sulfite exporter TauE/SafE family protein [Anaerolineales bacterium]